MFNHGGVCLTLARLATGWYELGYLKAQSCALSQQEQGRLGKLAWKVQP